MGYRFGGCASQESAFSSRGNWQPFFADATGAFVR